MTRPQPTNPNRRPAAPASLEALSPAYQQSFAEALALAPAGLSEADRHTWAVLYEARSLAEGMTSFGPVAPRNSPDANGGASRGSVDRTHQLLQADVLRAGAGGIQYLTAETRRIAEIPDSPPVVFENPQARLRALNGFSAFDPFLRPLIPYEEEVTPEQQEAARPRLSAVLDAMDQTAADLF